RPALAAAAAIVAVLGTLGAPSRGGRDQTRRGRHERFPQAGEAGDETSEAQVAAEQFAQARNAPGVVLPGAYGAAFASLRSLPAQGGDVDGGHEPSLRPRRPALPRPRSLEFQRRVG